MNLKAWSWIGDWTGRRALLTPKREALIDNITGTRYTFESMNHRANKLANALHEMGIKKGDRVGVYSKNRFDFLDLLFACGKLGSILVPYNVRLSERELEYLLGKTKPNAVFYDPNMSSEFDGLRSIVKHPNVFVMGEKKLDDDTDLSTLMKSQETTFDTRPKLTLDDPYLIVFTGGTSGLPKGAVLSHGLVFWNSVNTIVSFFPLFHTGGINVLLIPFFHIGAKSIIMGDFNIDETLRVIEEEKCSLVVGVPTMFNMMAESPRFAKTNFDSVRVFISGGAPCPVAIMEKYWKRDKILKMGYGLTEVGPNNFYLPESEVKRKPSSVGFPVFHCDMKIADDDCNEVPQGEVGELMLRGPHIFSGYYDEPEETAKVIEPDGWVHTGDLVMKDEEGFYFITGRKKDMFISGGENIYPAEIEELLYKHPAILEAAVVGVPDEKWGEAGKAFIVIRSGKSLDQEAILKYLTDKLAKIE